MSLDPETVSLIAGELTSLKFFPTEIDGRVAVMKLIGRMATSEDQVRWLVTRMLDLFDEWPGPRTLRMVFCRRFRPADGVDISTGTCPQFPDGIPSEKKLEAPAMKALPPGHTVSADLEMETAAVKLSIEKTMTRVRRSEPLDAFARMLRDIETAPCDREPRQAPQPTNPNYRPITQEDIDQALREHRAKKQSQTA